MIHTGDVLTVQPEGKFHAMLCDPPYELGFMGKDWDKTGIVFDPETWRKLGEHLHDGAFIMAFASSRGWHRLAVAIEDAGFIIHPTIFGWSFGSGFPKATRIDTQVDKVGGLLVGTDEICDAIAKARKERGLTAKECDIKFCEGTTNWSWYEGRPAGRRMPDSKTFEMIANEWMELLPYVEKVKNIEREVVGTKQMLAVPVNDQLEGWGVKRDVDITAPATPLAQSWVSHRYGLQALKPALEPIIVAQKPYKGKPVENITRTGAGSLWIDGGRISAEEGDKFGGGGLNSPINGFMGNTDNVYKKGMGFRDDTAKGRWPSNLLLYHTPECKQEGVRKVKSHNPDNQIESDTTKNAYGEYEKRSLIGHADSSGNETIPNWVCHESCPVAKMDKEQEGSARFFHQVQTQLDDADPIRYQAKASRSERDAGLEGMPLKNNMRVNAPRENEEEKTAEKSKNHHPCCKPIALAKYLATLLLPPKEYAPRRILVPFSGVGSEMIGCLQAGWEEVVGIEMSPEYVEIAEKRIKYYKDKMDNEPQAML